MRELSQYILDIAINSQKAKATEILIELNETEKELVFKIKDNGVGMSKDLLEKAADPFVTTRKTRKIGLGIPFLKLAAEQTGGSVSISSSRKEDSKDESHGTEVVAVFDKESINYIPLGDITSTLVTLIQGSPETDLKYVHKIGKASIELDTLSLVEVLKDRSSLREYEVLEWIKDHLNEQYKSIGYINC